MSNQATNDAAAIEAILNGADDPAPAARELPAIERDPGVIEARRRQEGVAARIRAAERDLAELVGDEDEGGEARGVIPRKFRADPDKARVHLEAAKLLGDDEAGKMLARLARFIEIKAQLPVLREADRIARERFATAFDAARRRLFPEARKVFEPVAREAAQAWLAALPAIGAMFGMAHDLRAGQLGDSVTTPFGSSVPVSGDAAKALARELVARGLLSAAEVEDAAPGLTA